MKAMKRIIGVALIFTLMTCGTAFAGLKDVRNSLLTTYTQSSVLAYWYLVKYFWLLLPFYGTIKETAVISYGKTKKVQNQTYG